MTDIILCSSDFLGEYGDALDYDIRWTEWEVTATGESTDEHLLALMRKRERVNGAYDFIGDIFHKGLNMEDIQEVKTELAIRNVKLKESDDDDDICLYHRNVGVLKYIKWLEKIV